MGQWKKKTKKKRGFRTKKEAEDALREINNQIESNMYVDAKYLTVRAYLNQWLETYAKINVSYTTYSSYRTALLNRLSSILNNKLSDLNPFIIQRAYTQMLNGGTSPTSVNYSYLILNQALKQAVRWKMLAVNPCAAVTPPKKAHVEKEILTVDEIHQVSNYLLDTDSSYYIIFMIAIATGMRRDEIAALEWPDINFKTNRIAISKAMKYNGEEIITSPQKTGVPSGPLT